MTLNFIFFNFFAIKSKRKIILYNQFCISADKHLRLKETDPRKYAPLKPKIHTISRNKKNLGRKDTFLNLRRKYSKKEAKIYSKISLIKKEAKTYKKEGSSFFFISIKKKQV